MHYGSGTAVFPVYRLGLNIRICCSLLPFKKENNTEIFTVKTLKQQKPKLFYQKSSNEITLTFTELSNSMSAIKQYLSNSAVIKKVTLSECSNGSVQITLQFKKIWNITRKYLGQVMY